jgi:UDP-N-acetylmuramate--alanine ligase
MFFVPQPLHFTGIGGIGMSGLAEIMHGLGCRVQGSDLRLSPVTERLAAQGIRVFQGHDAAHLGSSIQALITTSAAPPDNPELAEARRRGIPIVRRGELLAELMRARSGVAVGGSHGKTTTTSMIATVVVRSGLDPTVVVGGLVPAIGGSNARLGKGNLLITESDESDGSFLELSPVISVITNIDREHLDHYGTFDRLKQDFLRFANRVPFYGCVILCSDDPEANALLPFIRRRVMTYGTGPDAMLRVTRMAMSGAETRFHLETASGDLGEFSVPVPGRHIALNATAAAAVCLELGIHPDVVRGALAGFAGAGRRMELKGEAAGITVIDDYGHHPSEIRATLEALRLRQPRRLVVLFQPHRFSRTADLAADFAACFPDADAVRILDIYAASEPPIAGITGEWLATRIAAAGHPDVRYAGTLDAALLSLRGELQEGDLLVTLGAGNVTEAGPRLLAALRGE